ncbi:RNA helicase Mov10l1-like [Ciona intestinalis]
MSILKTIQQSLSSVFTTLTNRKSATPADLHEQDFENFLTWFHSIEPEKDDISLPSECQLPADTSSLSKASTKEFNTINGKVTTLFESHGLIDHYVYFEQKDVRGFESTNSLSIGDFVQAEVERDNHHSGWKATCVSLANKESEWNEENATFRIHTMHEDRGSIIGVITNLTYDEKTNSFTGCIEKDVKFNNENLSPNYLPWRGDWVHAEVSEGSVANNIRPLRSKQITGTVTRGPNRDRNDTTGVVNGEICFEVYSCQNQFYPRRLDQVSVVAIESMQGKYSWRAIEVNLIGRSDRRGGGDVGHVRGGWVLRGHRPMDNDRPTSLPSFLPSFAIPDTLRTAVNQGGDILSINPTLKQPLSCDNYAERFSCLLHLEELSAEKEIQSFQLTNISLSRKGEFLTLNVPGILDGKPSLHIGDIVILRDPVNPTSHPEHHGFIHHIMSDTEDLLLKFHDRLHSNFDEEDKYDASFTYSRTPYRRAHLAVKHAKQKFNSEILFSSKSGNISTRKPQTEVILIDYTSESGHFFNPALNERQQQAVQRILHGVARPKPYILFGPPGTGKTVTVVEAILQVIQHLPSSRVLVCAPSNSAVDLLCERLHHSGKVNPTTMVRFNAFRRLMQAMPTVVQQYCHPYEAMRATARYRIVLTTCCNAGNFYTLQLKSDHFSHVFVDESGQANEPECLVPIGLAAKGQIILTGDPQQLGAVLKSSYAQHYGLGISLLERLMQLKEYLRDDGIHEKGYNQLLVTKLVNNYRSHPALLTLPSKLFYHDELKACADREVRESLCAWKQLPNKTFPMLFHGVVGTQLREERSPSWFNPSEIVQLTRYVKLLTAETNMVGSASDIGVITPYKKQVEKIRLMFKALSVKGVKVGSVEEFQGQERKIIIISTVRSQTETTNENFSLSEHDCLPTLLGFVSNAKRFNVAITRAQALLIVIGNPFYLAKDQYWRSLLRLCVNNESYVGCDITKLSLLR